MSKFRCFTPFQLVETRRIEAETDPDLAHRATARADLKWARAFVEGGEGKPAPEPHLAQDGIERGAARTRATAASAKTWSNDEFQTEAAGGAGCPACGFIPSELQEHSLSSRNSLDQGTLEELDAIEDPLGAGTEDEEKLAEVRAGIDAYDRYGGEGERLLMRQQGCSGRAAREQLAKDDRWRKYRSASDTAKNHKAQESLRSLLAGRFREKVLVLPRNHTRADRAVACLDWH
jgi:hypothetical protein